jgi:thiazole biosynthesis enzyme
VIKETIISRAIIETYLNELLDSIESDVVIGGAGPSGLCAGYYLAKRGYKTVLFERGLKLGGGMPGGGMMFNKIVVQEEGKAILDEFDITCEQYDAGYYVANSLEATACLTERSLKAGLRIFNLISIEDAIVRDKSVHGVVVNWSSVEMAKLHIPYRFSKERW